MHRRNRSLNQTFAMRYICLLFCLVGFALTAWGQETFTDKKRRAKEFFYLGKYQESQSILVLAKRNNRQEDKESQLLVALCAYHLNQLNDAELALKNILAAEKSPFPETWLYLGKIFHDKQEFNRAIEHYKLYLRAIDFNHPNRSAIVDEIRRCSYGLQQQFRPTKAIVENLGPQINTAQDEFGPLQSPNFTDRLYFSSVRVGNAGGARNNYGQPDDVLGRYFSDIFTCQLLNGQWTGAQSMHYLLNSPQHEVLLDFNPTGKVLYYFKGLSFAQGQIMIDTFKANNRTLNSDPFTGPVDALAGLAAPHFFNDTLVIFPSQRPGGFGGLDLYKTVWKNGRWSLPQNLGPEINSAYDETTPFLARDGRTLYFSSNRATQSMGGFDVLRSFYIEAARRWTAPDNLGTPINSAGDETHFRLSRDGYTGFFASSRKDGFGERDLYTAYFFDYLKEMEGNYIAATTVVDQSPTGRPVPGPVPVPAAPPNVNAVRGEKLLLRSIGFGSDAEWQQIALRSQLEPLVAALQRESTWQVVLTVSSRQELALSSRLFSAMKSGENIALYLRERGISANAIVLRSQEPASDQGPPRLLRMQLLGPEGSTFSPFYEASNSPETGLHYRLLIGQGTGPYQGGLWSSLGQGTMEKNTTGGYSFYAGKFSRFADAVAARSRLGVAGLVIVPFLEGRRLNKEQVAPFVFKYPDLQEFLTSGN